MYQEFFIALLGFFALVALFLTVHPRPEVLQFFRAAMQAISKLLLLTVCLVAFSGFLTFLQQFS